MKDFVIFKNNKQDNPKSPTHRIMATINDTLTEIGACWAKEGKNGNKYLSCRLRNEFKDHTDNSKSKNGYNIGVDKPISTQSEVEDMEINEF